MILFLLKIIHYTNIDFAQFKNIYIYKFISHPNNENVFKNTVRSFHIQYYYTLTFKNKSKNDTITINCQQ